MLHRSRKEKKKELHEKMCGLLDFTQTVSNSRLVILKKVMQQTKKKRKEENKNKTKQQQQQQQIMNKITNEF